NRLLAEGLRQGPQEDPEVEPQRPVLDVPGVLLEPLGPRDLVPPLNLRPAGDPGPHRQPPPVLLGVVRDLLDEVGTRTDQAHPAQDDMDELRQLVEARTAQEAAAAGDPRVVWD